MVQQEAHFGNYLNYLGIIPWAIITKGLCNLQMMQIMFSANI